MSHPADPNKGQKWNWKSEVKHIILSYVDSETGKVHALTKLDLVIQSLLVRLESEIEGKKKDAVFVPDHTDSMYGGLVCRSCGGQEECECNAENRGLSIAQDIIRSYRV